MLYLRHVASHLQTKHEQLVVASAAGIVEQGHSVLGRGYFAQNLAHVPD